jgi:hypothetical protein
MYRVLRKHTTVLAFSFQTFRIYNAEMKLRVTFSTVHIDDGLRNQAQFICGTAALLFGVF